MTTGSIDRKTFSIAENWNELDSKTALKVVSMMYSEPPSISLNLEILKILLPISDFIYWKLDPEQVVRLLNQTRWVWDLPKTSSFPFNSFVHKKVEYITPMLGFENGSYKEFVAANIEFCKYTDPKNPDYSAPQRLVAILCRPLTDQDRNHPFWNGDDREPFHSEICRLRAKQFDDLPAGIMIMAAHYWAKLLEDLVLKYPIFDGESGIPDGGIGWVNTMFGVAEDGTFGSVKDVENEFFHKVCLYLVKKRNDYEKAKNESENNN